MRIATTARRPVLLFAALLAGTAASAQTAPAAPKPRPAPRSNELVVTGSRPQVIDLPDRLSFNVATDLGAQTGTVADALRNVPGVEVDLQGQVSLRGDSGVTILIDGRPSAQLKGDNRGDVLLSMPAGQIERVEVITNPGAAFSPEGSGGVLNLITKKARASGAQGTFRANIGGRDRGSVSLNLSKTTPGLTLTAEGALRRFRNRIDVEQTRERTDPLTGATLLSGQRSRFDNVITFGNGKLGLDHDLSKTDKLTAEVGYRKFDGRSKRRENYTGNVADPGFTRNSTQDNGQSGINLQGSWRHSFPGKDHTLVTEAELDRGRFSRIIEGVSIPTALPPSFERIGNSADFRQDRLKFDYKRPLGEGRSLNLGYEGSRMGADLRFDGARGAAPGALIAIPGFNNAFDYDQMVHSFYASAQVNKGKWEFLPGLRAEQADLDLRQITEGSRFSQNYFRLYPSLSVGRALSDTTKLKASYSRRIQRPSPLDLNPYTLYIDPQNVRRGNPLLRPETTDSYEVSLQNRAKGGTFTSLTGFHRRSRNGFTDIVQPLPGGILLTTRANLATAERTGVDAVLTGKVGRKLTYNLSGTLQQVTLDADGIGFLDRQSLTVISGRANVTWQPTPKDFFQLGFNAQGRQPLPQGYRVGTGLVNLGYRRKIDDKLSLLFTGQNMLDNAEQKVVIRSPQVRDTLVQKVRGRILMFGLAYNFGFSGNKKPRDPGFEFDPSTTSVGQ